MSAEILINAGVGEIRIAHLCHGRLEQLSFERTIGGDEGTRHCHSHIGDVVLGRVQRVLPGMQAAFVDVGLDRAGFLGLREAKILARETGDDTAISDCVREGDALLVQVIKDPDRRQGRAAVGRRHPAGPASGDDAGAGGHCGLPPDRG